MGGAGERDVGCEVGGSRTGGIHTELQQEEPRHAAGRLTQWDEIVRVRF